MSDRPSWVGDGYVEKRGPGGVRYWGLPEKQRSSPAVKKGAPVRTGAKQRVRKTVKDADQILKGIRVRPPKPKAPGLGAKSFRNFF
ncbi:MAG: hypothetical protein LC650_01950 [Actinobacteria bacterium]|nr:hypothetical protein [Actinomycetota bacterium]